MPGESWRTPGSAVRTAGFALAGGSACLACILIALYLPDDATLAKGLGKVLGLCLAAWLGAAAVVFVIEMAVSVEDTGKLIRTAILWSSPAAWLVPAALLLGTGMRPAAAGAGLLLAANAARLLFSGVSPKRVRRKHVRPSEEETPVFALSAGLRQADNGSILPGLAGALVLHFGLAAFFWGWRMPGAVLVAAATALWTRSSLKRGALQPNRHYGFGRLLLNLAPALLLALALWFAKPGGGGDVLEGDTVAALEEAVGDRLRAVKPEQRATKLVGPPPRNEGGGQPGIPALVLRPRPKPQRRRTLAVPLPPASRFSVAQLLSVEFTGEYRIFRLSSRTLPAGASVEIGTPLDTFYGTTDGSVMVTEAWQPLSPPADLSNCGRIRLFVRSLEQLPTLTTMQVVTAGDARELGDDLFGKAGRPQEETMEFPVPPERLLATGILVRFRTHPIVNDRSARVAIERIVFVPRGL